MILYYFTSITITLINLAIICIKLPIPSTCSIYKITHIQYL